MKTLHLDNHVHLGDNVWQMHYCNKLLKASPDVFIFYYANPVHFVELRHALYSEVKDRIVFREIEEKPTDSISTWINADPDFFRNHYLQANIPLKYEDFYLKWFERLSQRLGVPCPVADKAEMVFDNPILGSKNRLSDRYDFLVLNSFPMSGQYDYRKRRWDSFVRRLSRKYKVVVSETVNARLGFGNSGILSTRDYNLSLADIASLAVDSSRVIAVHSAPLIMTFNRFALADKDKEWYIFDHRNTYGFTDKCFWLGNEDIYCLRKFL